MIRRPPRSTLSSSSAASDVYKRQEMRRVEAVRACRLDALDRARPGWEVDVRRRRRREVRAVADRDAAHVAREDESLEEVGVVVDRVARRLEDADGGVPDADVSAVLRDLQPVGGG